MSIPDVSMQCQAEILQIALNKHTYFIVQYHKGVQVQTLDSNKADTWTLVLSYLLAWLHYHMQLVPSRPCLISLHSTAVCTMDFVAEACATITSSIINQKVLTAKPTYLYVRERVISTPSSPLHSKPWENPTHLYNQLSLICIWLLLLSSFLSPSLATVFISPGIVTYWRWGSQVSYGQPGCYIYTAGKSVAMLSFLSLKTEKQGGIPMHLRYFYGPPQSPIFQLF